MSDTDNQRLPTRYLELLETLADLEQGSCGFINRGDAEECEDLGLVEATPGGGYTLTELGRQKLKGASTGK